ncbi:hypothetical protein BHM03_00054459 [Ensete ventricosum]|nr:hypothetical protein BHM03_00054459 [Ensete ventricosum]
MTRRWRAVKLRYYRAVPSTSLTGARPPPRGNPPLAVAPVPADPTVLPREPGNGKRLRLFPCPLRASVATTCHADAKSDVVSLSLSLSLPPSTNWTEGPETTRGWDALPLVLLAFCFVPFRGPRATHASLLPVSLIFIFFVLPMDRPQDMALLRFRNPIKEVDFFSQNGRRDVTEAGAGVSSPTGHQEAEEDALARGGASVNVSYQSVGSRSWNS